MVGNSGPLPETQATAELHRPVLSGPAFISEKGHMSHFSAWPCRAFAV